MAPETNNPKLMDVQNIPEGNMIVQTLQSTSSVEISKAMKHFSFMNEANVDEMETKLVRNLHDYLDIRKLYEEELKKSYVYNQRIEELKVKAQWLEAKVESLKEKLNTKERNRVHSNTKQPTKVIQDAFIQTKQLVQEEVEPRRMSIDA